MKRVQAACICQMLHFMLKEDWPREAAVKLVNEEVERYKHSLDARHVQYRIDEETRLEDGSVRLKIVRQYNRSPVGDYI